jgi:hypothetical protein
MAITPRLFKMETVNRVRDGDLVSDGQGGWTPGPPVVTEMEGLIQPLSVRDALIARQEGVTVTHTLFAPWGDDWKRGDTVQAITRGFEAEVTGVRKSAKPGHHQRVQLEERQTGAAAAVES